MRSGQRRSWRSRGTAAAPTLVLRTGAALLAAPLLLSGCASTPADEIPSDAPTQAATTAEETIDPALAAACTDFWGDPDYTDPLSREVLDRAGTAPANGVLDPDFYALTGDDVEGVFADAPEDARAAAAELADWFRTEPATGEDADRGAFRTAWEGVAASCADTSAAAQWALGPGEDGTMPAALACAGVFDTPSTLTVFANANVLTSNMFKLVGLSPRQVPAGHEEELEATDELLAGLSDAVDDDAVREALAQVRAPFQDALAGDTSSDGLQDPLDSLAAACGATGYDAPDPAQNDSSAVVGAPAAPTDGTDQEGRS